MTDHAAVITAKKSRPWEKRSINAGAPKTQNADANRLALSQMDPCQIECGLTVEQVIAIHREQRERVLARLGLA